MKTLRRPFVYALTLSLLFGTFLPVTASAYEAAPYASTLTPTFITEKGARLNGKVNPNGTSDTYVWFEWGISGKSEVYETRRELLRGSYWGGSGEMTSQVDTSAEIVGLAPRTQYYFRQVAENSRGKDTGQTIYFTSKELPQNIDPIVVVQTNEAASVNETTATLRAYISPHGSRDASAWFEWGPTTNLEFKTSDQRVGSDSTSVEARLTRLDPGTLYYYRAVASNSEGETRGAMRVLLTHGTAPVVASEVPRDQNVPTMTSGDTASRTTTASGGTNAPTSQARSSWSAAPPAGSQSTQNRPGDFFSALFGRKNSATQNTEPNTGTAAGEGSQFAGVGASESSGGLWAFLTGKKDVEAVIQKIAPEEGGLHTPVEYRVAFVYRRTTAATNASLKIILPKDVIYIGDNTNNELLVEGGTGPERTYVLPLGALEKGSMRELSIVGMTLGEAKTFPDARARLEYTDRSGTHVVAAIEGETADIATSRALASAGSATNSLLPSSLIGWVFYILVLIGLIVGSRMLYGYYVKRREALRREDAEENGNDRPRFGEFLPGAEEVTV